jgi:hypothetical protein
VWESWRRVNRRSGYRFPHGISAYLREIGPWSAQEAPARAPVHGAESMRGTLP